MGCQPEKKPEMKPLKKPVFSNFVFLFGRPQIDWTTMKYFEGDDMGYASKRMNWAVKPKTDEPNKKKRSRNGSDMACIGRGEKEVPVLICVAGWKCATGDRASYIDYPQELRVDKLEYKPRLPTGISGCQYSNLYTVTELNHQWLVCFVKESQSGM
jgi:hypothetical protein